jgi:hypothetical protein
MKTIKYMNGSAVTLGRWTITSSGIAFDPEMEKHPAFSSLLQNGKLVIVDEAPTISELSNEKPDVTEIMVSAPETQITESPQIETGVPVVMCDTTSSPMVVEDTANSFVSAPPESVESDLDEIPVITKDPDNPMLKTTVPLTEAIEKDLETLDSELKKIADQKDIIVPEKKN